MDWIQLVVLALIQGLTEFLPVSSSAHLILPMQLFGWREQGVAFDVALHIGTLSAVLWYFRRDCIDMTLALFRIIGGRRPDAAGQQALFLMIATLPLLPAGLVLAPYLDDGLRSAAVIATATVVFGLLLGLADRRVAQVSPVVMTWRMAVLIGCAQAFALIPGTSRSGVTMTAALFAGLSRVEAARFSFLLSIPAIIASGAFELLELLKGDVAVDWGQILVGALLAGGCAALTIHAFLALVERVGMLPFVIYRLLLGAILFTFVLF